MSARCCAGAMGNLLLCRVTPTPGLLGGGGSHHGMASWRESKPSRVVVQTAWGPGLRPKVAPVVCVLGGGGRGSGPSDTASLSSPPRGGRGALQATQNTLGVLLTKKNGHHE